MWPPKPRFLLIDESIKIPQTYFMPKLGMEPIRRNALMRATISEIGRAGSLDVTVSQIAKRAGMSSALAHHYFGSKEQIFIAAMRHILRLYAAQVRKGLHAATTPRARLQAIIRASFGPENFRNDVIGAWMNFYVMARKSPDTKRLLDIYQRRLHSNLVHDFRPLIGGNADDAACIISALIDGFYIRYALQPAVPNSNAPTDRVLMQLEQILSHYCSQNIPAGGIKS